MFVQQNSIIVTFIKINDICKSKIDMKVVDKVLELCITIGQMFIILFLLIV